MKQFQVEYGDVGERAYCGVAADSAADAVEAFYADDEGGYTAFRVRERLKDGFGPWKEA